jgi:hypothetical protein
MCHYGTTFTRGNSLQRWCPCIIDKFHPAIYHGPHERSRSHSGSMKMIAFWDIALCSACRPTFRGNRPDDGGNTHVGLLQQDYIAPYPTRLSSLS